MKAKVKFIYGGIIIAIIAMIICSIAFKVNEKKSITELSPEDKRMMQYEQLTEDKEYAENCQYVRFAAYFPKDLDGDGYAEHMLGTCRQANSTAELWISVNVGANGYLKDGVINIDGQNFKYKTNIYKGDIIKNNYFSDNTRKIELNKINSGIEQLINGDIKSSITQTDAFSKVSKVTLTGTHVADDGTETPIEKTINLTVDWYGEASLEIKDRYVTKSIVDYNFGEDEEGEEKLTFNFEMEETKRQLIVQENVAEVTIPKLFDYEPISVTGDNIVEYNEETHIAKISKSITSSRNSYNITVSYPKKAFKQIYMNYTLEMPVKGYIKCYNNPNEEFQNPYITKEDTATATIRFIAGATVNADYEFSQDILNKLYVDKISGYAISKQKLIDAYNSNSEVVSNINYTVCWSIRRTTKINNDLPDTKVKMSEIKKEEVYGDEFDGNSMSEYIYNKGIYFSNEHFIDENGTVSVYDNDTNELIKKFTYDELCKYVSGNTYNFEKPVKHIRIETSNVSKKIGDSLHVYSIKELDVKKVTENFEYKEVENMKTITSTLSGTLNDGKAIDGFVTYTLIAQKSDMNIGLSEKTMEATEVLKNEVITLSAINTNNFEYAGWKDGTFLVVIPDNIAKVKVNSVSISKPEVELLGYDLYEKNGETYIKIITKNDQPTGYNIQINCDLTPDPRTEKSSITIKAYGCNEYKKTYYTAQADKYDINGNDNTVEMVAYKSVDIGINSPRAFVTGQTISEYNSDNDITISPKIAEITKQARTAKIGIFAINRYASDVSEVKILGKIPFEGNTYVNGDSLNSEYTTKMSSEGIQIPDELQDKVTVYYSENTDPTNDITDASNNWKTKEQVDNFDNVKTYLIIINNVMTTGKSYDFSYEIKIPEGIDSNKVAYSCHKVDYCVNSEDGKIKTSVQPTKLGMRIVRFYNFDMMKYKKGTTLGIQGAIFTLKEKQELEEDEVTRIITSNSQGKLFLENLRANQIYELKEIKAAKGYELDSKVVQFKVQEKENGELELVTLSNEGFAIAPEIKNGENGSDELCGTIENEPQYKINIKKVDKQTEAGIAGVTFSINGKNYITNANGELAIEELSIGKEYEITEKSATGYYKLGKVTFKLQKNAQNGLEFVSNSEESFQVQEIKNTEEESFINVNLKVINEKIPTYNLQILKVDENNEEIKLKGAKFQLTKHDQENSEFVTTDNEGKINISGLYQYVEGKDITGKYTLEEKVEPNGYCLSSEKINFVVSKNEKGEFVVTVENENTLETYKSSKKLDENTIQMVIQNKALFKIVKKDSETGEPLKNAQFAIYELNKETGSILDFAKGTNNNYVGTLNNNGIYVVTTDETGTITAPLKNGIYKMIEVGYPEGYKQTPNEEVFEITGNKQTEEETGSEEEITIEVTEKQTTETLEINYIEDLIDLANSVNNGNTYSNTTVKLKRTLDFQDDGSYKDATSTSYGDLNEDGNTTGIKDELTSQNGIGFLGIGTSHSVYDSNNKFVETIEKPFSGVFDGQNNMLKNIYMTDKDKTARGLFNYTKDAEIKNIGITGKIDVKGYGNIGALCGRAGDNINLINCYNECSINCISNKENFAANMIGGLIGSVIINKQLDGQYTVNIVNCHNSGEVVSTAKGDFNYIAGLIGYVEGKNFNVNVNMKNSYNTANINGTEDSAYVGALIGEVISGNNVQVQNCYNTGNISGAFEVGLLGQIIANDSKFIKCYNTGTVIVQHNYVGGIIGLICGSSCSFADCYNTGEIKGRSSSCGEIGGLIGQYQGGSGSDCLIKIKNCYNKGNIEANGFYVGGIIGSIEGKFQIEKSYNTGNIKSSDNVGGIVGDSHNGNGNIINCYNTGKIEGNLDYDNYRYVGGIIGYGSSNIAISECDNFGTVNVKNDTDGDIYAYVGGIAGQYAEITKCNNYGNIDVEKVKTARVGGIAGGYAKVDKCTNNGDINSYTTDRIFVGGIVGTNGNISDSINNGRIIAKVGGNTDYVGGITGNSNNVTNCSNNGTIDVQGNLRMDCYRRNIRSGFSKI